MILITPLQFCRGYQMKINSTTAVIFNSQSAGANSASLMREALYGQTAKQNCGWG